MKSMGALFKGPILRNVLKLEIRKRIGDIGVFDHLIKHVAGKLAPCGAKRVQRQRYADGKLQYCLENADLVKVRKEATMHDPYWTSPPGWTP